MGADNAAPVRGSGWFRCHNCNFHTSDGNVCLGCGEHRETATIPRSALVRVYEAALIAKHEGRFEPLHDAIARAAS